jgi:Tol biopolymer transport system component
MKIPFPPSRYPSRLRESWLLMLSLVMLFPVFAAAATLSPTLRPDGMILAPAFSPDGATLVFVSTATTLMTNDHNAPLSNVLTLDLVTGAVELVSVRHLGDESGDGPSFAPQFVREGKAIVFESRADNLVTNDFNSRADTFLRDLVLAQTTLVSVATNGQSANADSSRPSASADGRWVAFQSNANDLASADDGIWEQVYLRDMDLGVTILISTNSAGIAVEGGATAPLLSGDGRFVVFSSSSNELEVTTEGGASTDLYVRDRTTGRIEPVRMTTNGPSRSARAWNPALASGANVLTFLAADLSDLEAPLSAYSVHLETGAMHAQPVSTVPGVLISGAGGPVSDREGTLLAVEMEIGEDAAVQRGVWLWEPGAGLPRELTTGQLARDEWNFLHSPVVSANGSRIVALHTSGTLVIFNRDGELVGGPYPADDWSAPALSGEGRWLAFHSAVERDAALTRDQALFLVDLEAEPARLRIKRHDGGLRIDWEAGALVQLEMATDLVGTWILVPGATNPPVELDIEFGARVYRLRRLE